MAGSIRISSEPRVGLSLSSSGFDYLTDRIWDQFDPAFSGIRDEIYLPRVQEQMFIKIPDRDLIAFRAFVDAAMKGKEADPNANDQGALHPYYELWDKLIAKLMQDSRYAQMTEGQASVHE
jgi:hypothetical protein